MEEDELIEELISVNRLVDGQLSVSDFNELSEKTHISVVSTFGSWNEGKEAAGLDVYKSRKEKSKHTLHKEIVENNSCQVCDESFHGCLRLHHVNEKSDDIHEMKQAPYEEVGYDEYVQEVEKCALLCPTCHAKVHHRDHSYDDDMLELLEVNG